MTLEESYKSTCKTIVKFKEAALVLLLYFISTWSILGQSHIELNLLEQKVDSIVQIGLDSMAYPGCQVLVAHKGAILMEKAYGHHTYEKMTEVQLTDLYDLASVTKVSSGLPILMKLYAAGLINLDAPLSEIYGEFERTNKAHLTLREVLAHQAQLQPYIVFWQNAKKKNGNYKARTFKHKYKKRFPIKITDELYLHRKYKKKMYKEIKRSELLESAEYKYSGLLFLLLPEIIESYVHTEYEQYLYEYIYKPIGAEKLLYNPLSRYKKDEIVPTENDTFFRKQLVHGTVHDEAAAMLNGVSCNAGLFGNALSLSKLFQLYLNDGRQGDRVIIDSVAISEFTKYQYPEIGNRRGLGFDKPLINYNQDDAYVAKSASSESFGHSGFTGTFVWADPIDDLLVIFLSNRVNPTRSNRKLYTLGIRPKLHQAVYDVLLPIAVDNRGEE